MIRAGEPGDRFYVIEARLDDEVEPARARAVLRGPDPVPAPCPTCSPTRLRSPG
jgi:hypothetical protein